MARTVRDGDYLFGDEWDALQAAQANTGVESGCVVAAQASPDMTVQVASGVARQLNADVTVAAVASLAITASDATNPRYDIVVADGTTGVATAVAGTAAATPIAPDIPANKILLAIIRVPANSTTVTNANITDARVILTAVGSSQTSFGFKTWRLIEPTSASNIARPAHPFPGTALAGNYSTTGAGPCGPQRGSSLATGGKFSFAHWQTGGNTIYVWQTTDFVSFTLKSFNLGGTISQVNTYFETPDIVHLTYALGGSNLYRRSTDAGNTWGSAVTFTTAAADTPDIYASGTTVLVVFFQNATTIRQERSTNTGTSFTETSFTTAGGECVSVCVAGANVAIAYIKNATLSSIAFTAIFSTNTGSTYGGEVSIWAPGVAQTGRAFAGLAYSTGYVFCVNHFTSTPASTLVISTCSTTGTSIVNSHIADAVPTTGTRAKLACTYLSGQPIFMVWFYDGTFDSTGIHEYVVMLMPVTPSATYTVINGLSNAVAFDPASGSNPLPLRSFQSFRSSHFWPFSVNGTTDDYWLYGMILRPHRTTITGQPELVVSRFANQSGAKPHVG